MKKKFLYILGFIFIVCLSSNAYSMEVTQTREVQTGHAIFPFQAKEKPAIQIAFNDRKIKLESKIDGSQHSVQSPRVSNLILKTMSYEKEKIEKKLRLKLMGGEIENILTFIESDKEGREKMLADLPIIKHAKLAVNLSKCCFHRELNLGYYDLMRSLKNRIRDSSQASLEKDDRAWCKKISSWQGNRMIKIQQLRMMLRKTQLIPKILFFLKPSENVDWIWFSSNAKWAAIC